MLGQDFSSPNSNQQRAKQFYDRPYVTCKDCLMTKFKCKSCLEDLVGKLKQLRRQQEMAIFEQKKRNARSFAASRMEGAPTGSETAKHQKAIMTPAILQQPLVRLSSLKMPPTLHHALIELPMVMAQRPDHRKSMAHRAEHRKIKSISNMHAQKIFDQQQKSSILNKMFVHTLEVPAVEKSTIIVKQENKQQRNMRQKQMLRVKKELQTDAFLPEIRQLNITERVKQEKQDFTTIIQQARQKPQRMTENPMMERRQSVAAAAINAMPVSGWQTDQQMAQQDIFN